MKNIWRNSLIRKLNDRYIKKSDSFIFREFAKKLRKSSVIYKLNTRFEYFLRGQFFLHAYLKATRTTRNVDRVRWIPRKNIARNQIFDLRL